MKFGSVERLEADIDFDLVSLWEDIADVAETDAAVVWAIARAAWGRGYMFALAEPVEGGFAVDHGYRPAARRAA